MQNSRYYRSFIDSKKGELSILRASKARYQEQIASKQVSLEYILEAQELLQQTAQKTQSRLSFHISNFISSNLEAIWGEDAYTFSLEFIEKRNKTEVSMHICNDDGSIELGNLNDISTGGGILDIIALALRIALWSLQTHPQKVMILDQPFQNLDKNYLPKAGELIKELSNKLGLQFIIINHNPALEECADVIIEIEKVDGFSKQI